ncbi:MAG: hypothetical protein HDT44_04700 [Ruminococcaceae bacterium]|nr:hypothetical protein [Oscillospiraceae bacterium]
MNRKNKIIKAVLITFSALFTLSSFTSCSIGNEPKDSEATPETTEKTVTLPGQYLKDKKSFFSLGGKTFDLSLDFESCKEIFGDEMTVWWSAEIADKAYSEVFDELNIEYVGSADSENHIYTHIVQDGVYTANLDFIYNEETEQFDVLLFQTTFDILDFNFDNKEKIALDIAYTENGEIKTKDFPYETDKIDFSVDGFSMGKANNEQVAESLGECKIDKEEGHIRQQYLFEDYSLVLFYNNEGILKGAMILKLWEK